MEYIQLQECNRIKTELLVCRVCLSKNVKLYHLQNKLAEYYEEIARTNVSPDDGLPQHVCALCAALLRRAADVCVRSRHTYDILIDYIAEHGKLTTENLPQLNVKLTNRFVISNIESWNVTGSNDDDDLIDPIYHVNEINIEFETNETLENFNEYKEEYIDPPAVSVTTEYETSTEPIYHKNKKEIELDTNETLLNFKECKKEYIDSPVLSESTEYETITETIYHKNEKEIELDTNETIHKYNECKEEYIDNPALSETTEYETITDPIYHQNEKEINSKKLPKDLSEKKLNNKRKNTIKKTHNTKRKRKNPDFIGFQKKSEEEFAEFAKEHNCELLYLLTKEQKIAAMESKKKSERYIKGNYKCELCCTSFTTKKTFKKHQTIHDPKTGPYECEICSKRYATVKLFSSHKRTHLLVYTCKQCGVVSNSTNHAKFHYQTHLAIQYECEFCEKKFDRIKSRLEHVRIHHGSTPCPLCYEKFARAGLRQHMALMHRETFKCESCTMEFATEAARETHQNSVSDGQCGELKPCARCGEPFFLEEDLQAHIATVHIRMPRKILKTQGNHKSKTKNQRSPPTIRKCSCEGVGECTCGGQPRQPGDKKLFMCEICGAGKMQSSWALKMHQRIHTGEMPFQCPFCPKKFRIKDFLEIHVRTHTGDRPFKCAQCGKAFKACTAMFRHEKNVHTNIRRFRCHICDKPFHYKAGVQVHVNSVHLKIPNKPRIRKRKPRPSPPVSESED